MTSKLFLTTAVLLALVICSPAMAALTITCNPLGGADYDHETEVYVGNVISCSIPVANGDGICGGWGAGSSSCGKTSTTCNYPVSSYGRIYPQYVADSRWNGALCVGDSDYTEYNGEDGWFASYGITAPTTATFSEDGTYLAGMRVVQDMVNPVNNGVFVDGSWTGTTFQTTYVKYKEEVVSANLVNVNTGSTVATRNTGANGAGTITWNATTDLIESGAAYGQYTVVISVGYGKTPIISNVIYYTPYSDTSMYFTANNYGVSSPATIAYNIDGYTPLVYLYRINVTDVYGNVVETKSLSGASGTTSITTPATQGVIFATMEQVPLIGDTAVLAWDYAQVASNLMLSGYVNDDTGTPLASANVSFVQGTAIDNLLTDASGHYDSSETFVTGNSMSFNVTKSEYRQWYVDVVPISGRPMTLNFTLPRNEITVTGTAIGGIAYEGSKSGTTLTGGLGNPISGATVTLMNTSNSQRYTRTSNVAGWYLGDAGDSVVLVSGRPYDVWGEKTGYQNSVNYTVVPE